MKRDVLTDVELRARWNSSEEKIIYIKKDTLITPAAMDFIREQGIEVRFEAPTMSRTPIPQKNGKASYVLEDTGEEVGEKPEHMTHLWGNHLVSKSHPRIALRGGLDSLMAKIMYLQALCDERGEDGLSSDLGDLLDYVRDILGAEVKNQPLGEMILLGLDAQSLREHSHDVKRYIGIDHPIPDHSMGLISCALNELRAFSREVELMAMGALEDTPGTARDTVESIIKALNRLSSGVYILFCRRVAAGDPGARG